MEGAGKQWRRNQTGAEARADCDPRQWEGPSLRARRQEVWARREQPNWVWLRSKVECHQFPESQRPLMEGTLGIKAIATGYPKNTWWESIIKIIIRSPSLSNSDHLKSRIHFIKHSRKAFMCIYTSIYIQYIYICIYTIYIYIYIRKLTNFCLTKKFMTSWFHLFDLVWIECKLSN